MNVLEIIAVVVMCLGAFLMLMGALGVARFPDVYSRLHAAGKSDTFGQGLILIGLMCAAGLSLVSVKLVLITGFILIINPTATHALARASWVTGIKPWTREVGGGPTGEEAKDEES